MRLESVGVFARAALGSTRTRWCLAVSLAPTCAMAQTGFTGIGVPGGWARSEAYAASDDGQVVAGVLATTPAYSLTGSRAMRWTPGGGSELLAGAWLVTSRAVAISPSGDAIVGRYNGTGALWTSGELRLLAPAPGVNGSDTEGTAVADNAAWVAGSGLQDMGGGWYLRTGCRWLTGATRPEFFGSGWWARGASGAGDLLVGQDLSSRPVWWRGGLGMIWPELPPTSASGASLHAARDGTAVVGYASYRAALWGQDGRFRAWLGELPGDTRSTASAAADHASLVVGRSYVTLSSVSLPKAVIWRANGGPPEVLRDVLISLGNDLDGWLLHEAKGINPAGTVVVGWGTHTVGGVDRIEGWVARLPSGFGCYANCDQSTQPPMLNIADFTCFLQRYAAGEPYANCDQSTVAPVLNVADFTCFLQRYAAGCP